MKLNESNGKVVATYALILGAIYFILGILEVVEGFGPFFGVTEGPVLGAEHIPADLFGGLATIVIGAVYFGAAPLWKAKYESLSFLLVGVLISTVFGALYLLILGANGFGAYLAGEEWEWMADLLRPEIWLFFLSLPLGYFALKVTRTKKEL
jgi:hypothetical protein